MARYAIYYTPPPYSPLARFGAGVIGYDCFEKADAVHILLKDVGSEELAFATATPRRYGFHATIFAPFTLRDASESDLVAALDGFCASHVPVHVGALKVEALEDFVALTPPKPVPELSELENACVEYFADFRTPLSAEDRGRRMAAGLTARQQDYLDQWGYPYVFEEFRFHMTLTGRLSPADRPRFLTALTAVFAPLAGNYLDVDALSLLRQKDRESRFEIIERRVLRGR